ncbi:MAG: lamin tail domain-containing protein, partial [Myxococcota bacterium]|nr:lamin tail domain-containing protein [Myxococcota bacterium]
MAGRMVLVVVALATAGCEFGSDGNGGAVAAEAHRPALAGPSESRFAAGHAVPSGVAEAAALQIPLPPSALGGVEREFDRPSFAVVSTTLVINEIDYDMPGGDSREFIEIRNVSAAPISLSGWTVVLVDGGGASPAIYRTIVLPAVALPAGAYFVICGNAANVPNCNLDTTPDTGLIQNGAPDAVALYNGVTLIDTVSYEGNTGAPFTEGSGVGLEDTGATASMGIARFPNGADTDVNNVDLAAYCITPGKPNDGRTTGCLCGDGTIGAGEACDPNAPSTPCCRNDCTGPATAGTVCRSAVPGGCDVQET